MLTLFIFLSYARLLSFTIYDSKKTPTILNKKIYERFNSKIANSNNSIFQEYIFLHIHFSI